MKHVTNRIQAFISGELDGEHQAAVEEHLNECSACRMEVDRARRLWDVLGAAGTPTVTTGSVWPAVQARTIGRETSEREWFFGAGQLTRAGLATAAVAAGLMLGVLLPAGPDPESRTRPAARTIEQALLTSIESWFIFEEESGSCFSILTRLPGARKKF